MFRGAQVLRHTRTYKKKKKKKDRRQILRPSRMSRECLNVCVLHMCTYVFCTFDELENNWGAKCDRIPCEKIFEGGSPLLCDVDDNSLRVEIFGYWSNGIMQIYFISSFRWRWWVKIYIYILHFSSSLKPLNNVWSIETISRVKF